MKKMLIVILMITMLVGCAAPAALTSIEKGTDGTYVMTGVRGGNSSAGFVWIGKYDPATNTMTVKEYNP